LLHLAAQGLELPQDIVELTIEFAETCVNVLRTGSSTAGTTTSTGTTSTRRPGAGKATPTGTGKTGAGTAETAPHRRARWTAAIIAAPRTAIVVIIIIFACFTAVAAALAVVVVVVTRFATIAAAAVVAAIVVVAQCRRRQHCQRDQRRPNAAACGKAERGEHAGQIRFSLRPWLRPVKQCSSEIRVEGSCLDVKPRFGVGYCSAGVFFLGSLVSPSRAVGWPLRAGHCVQLPGSERPGYARENPLALS
jgi:hypothetical protein